MLRGGAGGFKTATLVLCLFNLLVAAYLSYVVLLPLVFRLTDGLTTPGGSKGDSLAELAKSPYAEHLGTPSPDCNIELATDYDGYAVKWGLDHLVETAAECCQACLDSARSNDTSLGPDKRCNTWVYCPRPEGCFAPDIYDHKHKECWLKYSESPKINYQGNFSEEFRGIHKTCPPMVEWVAGRVSA